MDYLAARMGFCKQRARHAVYSGKRGKPKGFQTLGGAPREPCLLRLPRLTTPKVRQVYRKNQARGQPGIPAGASNGAGLGQIR